jgi:prepilin-type N-terminal cleavage/methylation domain-containing protein
MERLVMSRRRRGFTLIDLLVVIAIIAIIAVLICWAWLDEAWNYAGASNSAGTRFAWGNCEGGTHQGAANKSKPCAINCTDEICGRPYIFHPGTCGISLCSGSVPMISENVSVITYTCLVTDHSGFVEIDSAFCSPCIGASSRSLERRDGCSSSLCCSLVW